MYTAWAVKYRPKSLTNVIGNREAIQKLADWVRSWDDGPPKKRAVFIHGPPGIGKTVSVEAIANDLHMELVEKNASDYRTEDAINHFAGLASQFGSFFEKRRVVLLDELDGLTGTADKGGVRATTDVIKVARCPIVLIANNAYDPRFSNLRSYCLLLEFKKPSVGEILKLLKTIGENEKIDAGEDALKFVAQRSESDVRSAVNDFQALAQGKGKLAYEDVSWLSHRDRQDTIFNVLRMIIYGKTCAGAKQAVNMSDVDIDMLLEWVYENIPDHFTDPHDLAEAMKALSTADIYRRRIRSSRDWSLLRYVIDYLTAGVAMSRQNTKASGWIPFKFPSRIQMLSRSRAERATQLSIGRKIKQKCHISAFRASKEVLPYLRIIFESNAEMAAGLAKWLDLDQDMIGYIAGSDEKADAITRLPS